MSVYTQLSQQDFGFICETYQLGEVVSFKGVADGIENTTYFFISEKEGLQSEWVFTLFEYTQEQALPYYLELYDHLYQQGVPVPDPLLNTEGSRLITLYNKPGAVFPKLPGRTPKQLTADLCHQCGVELAKFHRAGESYKQHHQCPKGLAFWQHSVEHFDELSSEDKALIQDGIKRYQDAAQGLPKTSVHGDLFHDNVLVDNNKITAIIDLFNASYDYAVYDLAITLNDWTLDEQHHILRDRYQAMLDGYESVRPLSDKEKTALPIMQQTSAMRWWLSRIDTARTFQTQQGDDTSSKDPNQMKAQLLALHKQLG
ncbi:homoserine kinase [Litoribrevibacter euphylliae]|uniref:Homoserine kinase n=1 Tax=Litoribrevibacter euphylliae TaxID=1834034 RepID=A0ABV7HJK3_9GAMM